MRLVLVGAGGHAAVVLDALRRARTQEVVAIVDADPKLRGTSLDGVPVVGDESVLRELRRDGVEAALVCVGMVDVTEVRRSIYERLVQLGFELPVVAHPAATIAASARIGHGTVVLAGAVINPHARLGANVIVNTGALVDHDVVVGDHVHISPGAHVAGGVHVGAQSHVGIASTIIQGIHVGSHVLIAAGAVVVDAVPDRARVAGVPARPLGEEPRTSAVR